MSIRVLIADDQAEMRDALAAVVHAQPSFELVGVAADAIEAVDLACRLDPDVALLDVRMPGGGGPHAAREIAKHAPRTRVVAVSAHDDRETVFSMLEAGAVGYLVKGTSPREIHGAIVASARGESALSPTAAAEVVRGISEQLRRETAETDARHEMRARVESVLAADGLWVAFQPIVELSTGHAVGFEALTRSAAPVDAGVLFAEASEIGLRSELELAALRAAVSRVAELPLGTFLSVNLSPEVIVSFPLLELLGKASAHRTVIEVTEHARVNDYAALARAVQPARALGARLAVDDAGAGYASLRHVLKLEPDIIKLDVALIRDLDADRGARALASSLVTFAREMDQLVIAEGIETARTVDVLEALGVRYGQGYYFARPSQHLPVVGQA